MNISSPKQDIKTIIILMNKYCQYLRVNTMKTIIDQNTQLKQENNYLRLYNNVLQEQTIFLRNIIERQEQTLKNNAMYQEEIQSPKTENTHIQGETNKQQWNFSDYFKATPYNM